jgi:hypothetical protein
MGSNEHGYCPACGADLHVSNLILDIACHVKKDLTDDEIEEFAYAFELWQLNNPDKALEGIKDFARAILKKASEK